MARSTHGTQRPRVINMSQDVHEERRRPLVANKADGLHDRLSGLRGAVGERLLERAVSLIRPDVEHGPDGFALNLQLRVVEQEGELRQRLAAAELAQQVNRRPPDRRDSESSSGARRLSVPSRPNAISSAARRSRVRTRSSTESASASERMMTSPIAWQIRFDAPRMARYRSWRDATRCVAS